MVRKHDCALLAQYTKHSNARGHSFRYYRVLSKALLGFSVPDNQPSMTAHYKAFLKYCFILPLSPSYSGIVREQKSSSSAVSAALGHVTVS